MYAIRSYYDFYFDNENTSYLRTSSSDWSSSNANTIYALNLSPQYKQLETSFVSSGETLNGYDNVKKRKRTGTYIEAFTNDVITSYSIHYTKLYEK